MAKQNKVSALQKHKTSDKIKWFVVFTLVLLLIASVVAICVTLVPGSSNESKEENNISSPVTFLEFEEEDPLSISFEYDPEKPETALAAFSDDIFQNEFVSSFSLKDYPFTQISVSSGEGEAVLESNDLYYYTTLSEEDGFVAKGIVAQIGDLSISIMYKADSFEELNSSEMSSVFVAVNGQEVETTTKINVKITGILQVIS